MLKDMLMDNVEIMVSGGGRRCRWPESEKTRI